MHLVYGLGLGFVFGVIGSFLILFIIFKSSLRPSFVPKVEGAAEISASRLISQGGKFFNYEKNIVLNGELNGSFDEVSPPAFGIRGLILSKSLRGVFIIDSGKVNFLEEGKKYKGYELIRVGKEGAEFRKGEKSFFLRFEPVKGSTNLTKTAEVASIPKEVVINRREIESITKDPAKMFTQIRLVPYIKNGKTEGFIFEWVKPGSLFHRLGIRRGDILVSINNLTITSGEDAFRILQMIRNEPNLKVVLIRKGKREEIDVRIE
ncbi:type II secretion system protein GspC [Aquifex pyrophilus]